MVDDPSSWSWSSSGCAKLLSNMNSRRQDPVIKGAAKRHGGRRRKLGKESIFELNEAVDDYIRSPQRPKDQPS